MTHIANIDLNNYRNRIADDIKSIIEKYHSIVEGNIPDIDDGLADALILKEMRNALKSIQDDKLEKIIN